MLDEDGRRRWDEAEDGEDAASTVAYERVLARLAGEPWTDVDADSVEVCEGQLGTWHAG